MNILPGSLPPGAAALGGGLLDTGWVIAGSGATANTGSGPSWTNPGNITAEDAANATTVQIATTTSDDLRASNFGLAIPLSATIVGVEVRAKLAASFIAANYGFTVIGKDDATLGTPKAPGVAIGTTLINYDQGGVSDLWGLSLTPAEVNAATFQARIRVSATEFLSVACDAMWIKVYYFA